ncbi:MAG TPA: efflux RND transporter periplasmic adaptor subunit [Opitutaceae bacterium]|nr:efflux RND transporter periplasmic adaptor subunit [Opitutaceae bacterium]
MNASLFFSRGFLALACLLPLAARLDAKIGALGRIIPEGDILNLAGTGDAVAIVHVKEGDVVEAGAPLITFRGQQDAQEQVTLAELDLHDAQDAGGLSLEAAEMKLEMVKRDYEFAKMRLDRFGSLGGETLSPQQMEQRTYQTKAAELAYHAAEKDLERAKMDRDIKLKRAVAQLAIARSKLERTTLRAPRRLTVLKVNATVGAIPGGAVVSLGNLDEMHVVTEVFAGDLAKLKAGQEATITGTALPGAVKGHLLTVGHVITGRAKVAEVLIRLDDPKAASQLINLEVNVSIED